MKSVKSVVSSSSFLKTIVPYFLASRLMLAFVGWTARAFAAPAGNPNLPTRLTWARFIDMWGRWDTGWYLQIIRDGYTATAGPESATAFFPLYPYLVGALYRLLGSPEWPVALLAVGVVVSNVCFLAALVLMHRLMRLKTGDTAAADRVVLYLCVAPLSLVFSAFYSESLFLLLTVGAFYAAERGRWGWVAVAVALAAMTRATGVLLALPLWFIWWRQWLRDAARGRDALAPLAGILGLLAFMLILWRVVGDPLAFMRAGAAWGSRTAWPWQAFTSPFIQTTIHSLNIGLTLLTIALSLAAWRFGLAYVAWGLVCAVGPLVLKGNLGSMSRYVVVAFPAFMALSALVAGRPRLHDAVVVASSGVLRLMMALWVHHYFVV